MAALLFSDTGGERHARPTPLLGTAGRCLGAHSPVTAAPLGLPPSIEWMPMGRWGTGGWSGRANGVGLMQATVKRRPLGRRAGRVSGRAPGGRSPGGRRRARLILGGPPVYTGGCNVRLAAARRARRGPPAGGGPVARRVVEAAQRRQERHRLLCLAELCLGSETPDPRVRSRLANPLGHDLGRWDETSSFETHLTDVVWPHAGVKWVRGSGSIAGVETPQGVAPPLIVLGPRTKTSGTSPDSRPTQSVSTV